LDELAAYLVKEKFDLRSLMRLIAQSNSYQRSSKPRAGNEGDKRFYSRYYPRRLMAEVAMDAISQASGVATAYPNYPPNWRAIQLPDTKVASTFLDKFGRPKRDATCECERTSTPSMVQALHLANGDSLNQKLKTNGNRIDQILKMNRSPAEMIDEVYLTSASRFPSEQERSALVTEWTNTPEGDRRAFMEDLFWSILSSKEFLFNH
jgi:hypothetical protein